jgi:hypothetical protein
MRVGFAVLAAAVCACGGSTDGGGGAASTGAGAGTSAPTWYEHVAPIVYESCLGCHVAGGIAPFPLIGYDDAKAMAGVIAGATKARTMPPWHADNSGACHTWADARWLSDADIATIGAWAAAGAPAGDAAKGPKQPQPPAALGDATVTLDMGVAYTPNSALSDDYRCFVLDPALTTGKFLTDYQVTPGDPRVVHHVILYALDSDTAVTEAEQKDASEAGPGYTCFGGAAVASHLVAGWAPGTPVTHYPAGTGLALPAKRKMVLQVHYNVAQGSFPDRTKIAMKLVDSVPRPASVRLLTAANLVLPPNQKDVKAENATSFNQTVSVYGMYPHMHQLGTSLKVEHTSGAGTSCMLDVPDWDFHWQQFYFYEKPVAITATDSFAISCHYDTMGQTKTVTWGEGTADEMCLNFFYMAAAPGACTRCNDILAGTGDAKNLCTGSTAAYTAIAKCGCQTGCSVECDATCKSGSITSGCMACIQSKCGSELAACSADK